ncbi:MAG: NUDIX hydrolase, partial [Actinomycetales bacterium]|nr:NUDIX hydrolase [Actinomycetales bacterium]
MASSASEIHVAVDLTVLTLRDGALNVLLIQRDDEPHRGAWALPGGFIELGEDLDAAAYRVLADEASLGSGAVHLEQVRTFGTPGRVPRGHVVSVSFMALGANLPDPRRGDDV